MKDIIVLSKNDEKYPKKLLKIKDAPEKIFALGNLEVLNKQSVGIVGSRECTEYGWYQSYKFSNELAKNNICIVSGLAVGIDSAAHIGAKDEIGKTVAVLGSGFNHIYPKENENLFWSIIKNDGCIISEYDPDILPDSSNFPKRNRIVSGLSSAILVVEAKYRSGTTITANYAKEQGKDIFCVPSNLGIKAGYGTNRMISEGAKIVLEVEDILKNIKSKENKKKKNNINNENLLVYEAIGYSPIHINEICKKTNLSIVKVNSIITILEIEGYIKQIQSGSFIKVR